MSNNTMQNSGENIANFNPRDKPDEPAAGASSTPQDLNAFLQDCNLAKVYSLDDSFCIKEIVNAIANSIAEKLGSSENILSDEACEFLARKCFQNLSQVIEKGLSIMRQSGREVFTVEDFKMGEVCNNPMLASNICNPFFVTEDEDESSDSDNYDFIL